MRLILILILKCVVIVSFSYSQSSSSMLLHSSMDQLEDAMKYATRKHTVYSFNIANITTPGFEPILFPEDQQELNRMAQNDEYSDKVILEHMTTGMAKNRNLHSGYMAIYKKRFDTYRQIATMGKR